MKNFNAINSCAISRNPPILWIICILNVFFKCRVISKAKWLFDTGHIFCINSLAPYWSRSSGSTSATSALSTVPATSAVLTCVNLAMKSARACPLIVVWGRKFTSNYPNSIAYLRSLPEASSFYSTWCNG